MIRGRLVKISGHRVENGGSCMWILAKDFSRANLSAGLLIPGQGLPANVSMVTRTNLEAP